MVAAGELVAGGDWDMLCIFQEEPIIASVKVSFRMAGCLHFSSASTPKTDGIHLAGNIGALKLDQFQICVLEIAIEVPQLLYDGAVKLTADVVIT